MTIKSVDVTHPSLDDPFDVADTIEDIIGESKASMLKTGEYLINVRNEGQAKKLTKIKRLKSGTKVKIERHATLNQCKFIIKHMAIDKTPDDVLLTRLKAQGVTEVRSIGANNKIKIITMKGTVAPKVLKVGILDIPTTKYYPLVKVCHKCREIGHTTLDCSNAERCSNCSASAHGDCLESEYCLNCGGGHRPASKGCPLLKQEKDITKIQVDTDCSNRRARKMFKKRHPGKYLKLPMESTEHAVAETEAEEDETERRTPPKEFPPSPKPSREETQAPNDDTPEPPRLKQANRNSAGTRRSSSTRKKPTPKLRKKESDDEDDFIPTAERALAIAMARESDLIEEAN